ncbi:hypothetical protein N0V93_009570 [Gnomoniopsis smithogilvyi]|uniref:Uncharacterized protein n=1 Tax=Gnomoniopsis smithogilvyi TaxID=1191159 RepID=A0A9W8YK58_9PEZI|nr:hypothetical protein N0V93_009570 [Gnomoniopsis smithogilvyi]
MPPKQDAVDLAKSDVAILCNILMSVADLKLDHKSLAPILGLSSTKNVNRSLNGRLKPYGFEYRSGTISQIGQESAASADDEEGQSSGAAALAIAAADDNNTKTSKVPKTPKAPKTAKAAKTPASKKRKVEEVAEELNDASDAVDASVKDEGHDSDIEA